MSARMIKLSDALRDQIGEALKPLRPEKVILLDSPIAETVCKKVHLA